MFAVCDHWRRQSGVPHALLQRLQWITERGEDESRWFSSAPGTVYAAVFLSGPSARLHLLSAVPKESGLDPPLLDVSWDLAKLGLQRLLANTWHHVTVNIADQTAQLFVDGQTSSSKEGWIQCMKRDIPPIVPLATSRLGSLPWDYVSSNASVVNGAINAILYGVQAYDHLVKQNDIVSQGTIVMQRNYKFSEKLYAGLGFYMLFGGLGLFTIMIVVMVVEFVDEHQKKMEDDHTRAVANYASILELNALRPVVEFKDGKQFSSLSFESASMIVKLSDEVFGLVLEDLEKLAISSDGAKADLLALLWKSGAKTFKPSERWRAVYEQWAEKETNELSYEGHLVLPQDLWEAFAESYEGNVSTRRGAAIDGPSDGQAVDKDNVKMMRKIRVAPKGGGKAGGKSSSGTRRQTDDSADDSDVSGNVIFQMILPVLMALQSASMYMSAFGFPDIYKSLFSKIMYIASFNFFNIPGLPELVGPLLIFGIGVLVVLILTYFAAVDHRNFLRFASLYVQKRDKVDAPKSVRAAGKSC